ncbi:hypothetical protein EG68_02037 [Paragonimus skrjabini miyazakii]|uniref:Uncharacterized protein n=1 Tax=Paragonimus skrjabini miyazakii TaxID=59628 RepID=A0A8S9Z0P1_9TREM|nr:hypothetical protein EG68_02037 [Paragonimus skrjabini miyazakii]
MRPGAYKFTSTSGSDDKEHLNDAGCRLVAVSPGIIAMIVLNSGVIGINMEKKTPSKIVLSNAGEARLYLTSVVLMISYSEKVIPELPLDARALLRTPKDGDSTFVVDEKYIHFQLNDCISHAVRERQM